MVVIAVSRRSNEDDKEIHKAYNAVLKCLAEALDIDLSLLSDAEFSSAWNAVQLRPDPEQTTSPNERCQDLPQLPSLASLAGMNRL